jgi:hypothetical protein
MADVPETYFQGDEDGSVNLYCTRPECAVEWTLPGGLVRSHWYMKTIDNFHVIPSDVVDLYTEHVATHKKLEKE